MNVRSDHAIQVNRSIVGVRQNEDDREVLGFDGNISDRKTKQEFSEDHTHETHSPTGKRTRNQRRARHAEKNL
jgi:hypothetical protein